MEVNITSYKITKIFLYFFSNKITNIIKGTCKVFLLVHMKTDNGGELSRPALHLIVFYVRIYRINYWIWFANMDSAYAAYAQNRHCFAPSSQNAFSTGILFCGWITAISWTAFEVGWKSLLHIFLDSI